MTAQYLNLRVHQPSVRRLLIDTLWAVKQFLEPLPPHPEFVWFVLFNDGIMGAGSKAFSNAVRAVRTGP